MINIEEVIELSRKESKNFVSGNRNQIKIVNYNNLRLSIKSFKIPSFFLGVSYRFFRKSKARRSYEYACFLKDKGIGTPEPYGYYEETDFWRLKSSFYVCEHLENSFLFRDLFDNVNPDFELILRAFAQFTYQLHENGIEFLDHSPGNTLITRVENGYRFYLVDLNRMRFHKSMNFVQRMKNFDRILPSEIYRRIVSDEYAKLYNMDKEVVFLAMNKYSIEFFKRFDNKKLLKKMFKIK